ncbi:MAG: DUF503 domain-containing protein [Myxococcales bacterium]|nr:DUF503 domain-containing protein [Myxococcales bacterium]
MFVCVARLTLDIPAAASLKAKRQVLRRVTDRVKAKFNVAVAEVEDNDVWNRAVVALAVVGNERRHVNEQMDKILQFIDDLYVAPVASRELEILAFGEDLFAGGSGVEPGLLTIPRGERSLAEAEGLGAWETRHERQVPPPTPSAPGGKKGVVKKDKLSLDDARALARGLRNRREWEKGKP